MLRNKAALRNPDEFYFAMQNQRTRDGVHVARCVVMCEPLGACWRGVLTRVWSCRPADQTTFTRDELRLLKVRCVIPNEDVPTLCRCTSSNTLVIWASRLKMRGT